MTPVKRQPKQLSWLPHTGLDKNILAPNLPEFFNSLQQDYHAKLVRHNAIDKRVIDPIRNGVSLDFPHHVQKKVCFAPGTALECN